MPGAGYGYAAPNPAMGGQSMGYYPGANIASAGGYAGYGAAAGANPGMSAGTGAGSGYGGAASYGGAAATRDGYGGTGDARAGGAEGAKGMCIP